jgi:uncharacterized protein DUF6627
MTPIRSVIFSLIVAVPCATLMQMRAEAMLVPAHRVQGGQQVNQTEDLRTIQTTLESKVLRDRLHALGLSDAEIEARLSRLSDAQRHQLASQIRAVHPAGDDIGLFGVLLLVVLVLLIIYLAKRI